MNWTEEYNDGVEELAVLNGYSQLNPNIDYIGFDGIRMHPEFVDEEYSEFLNRRRKRRRSRSKGGFGRFLDGIGLSPEAAKERRALKRRKQSLAERQQTDARRSEQENLRLQQQAVQQAAAAPTGEADLAAILNAPSVSAPRPAGSPAELGLPIAPKAPGQKGWKSLKTWQKGAIIGGGVLVLAGVGYAIYKSQKG